MGGNDSAGGPSEEQQQQLADEKAKNRRAERKIDIEQVQNLRAASSEGGLLASPLPALLSPPGAPTKPAKLQSPPSLFGRQ